MKVKNSKELAEMSNDDFFAHYKETQEEKALLLLEYYQVEYTNRIYSQAN